MISMVVFRRGRPLFPPQRGCVIFCVLDNTTPSTFNKMSSSSRRERLGEAKSGESLTKIGSLENDFWRSSTIGEIIRLRCSFCWSARKPGVLGEDILITI